MTNKEPDLLSVLKRMHEKGYEFERSDDLFGGQLTEEVLLSTFNEFKVGDKTYHVPSVSKVEEDIVKLAKKIGKWESLRYTHDFGENKLYKGGEDFSYVLDPIWDLDKDVAFENAESIREFNEDRLTACCLLLDKLMDSVVPVTISKEKAE